MIPRDTKKALRSFFDANLSILSIIYFSWNLVLYAQNCKTFKGSREEVYAKRVVFKVSSKIGLCPILSFVRYYPQEVFTLNLTKFPDKGIS